MCPAPPLSRFNLPHSRSSDVASLLLSVAADDIPNKHKVRTLVENIWEVRTLKIRNGLRVVDGEVRLLLKPGGGGAGCCATTKKRE